MKKLLEMVGIAAGVCVVASCASVKVHSWTDPASEGRPIRKTAVMGVTKSSDLRHRYEDTFVAALGEAGVEAVASYTFLPQGKKPSKAEMAAELGKMGVDSIIVTRSLGEHEGVRYEPPAVSPGYFGSYYGFYNWSYNYVNAPGYAATYVETKLEANLYDVKSGKLVWSGSSEITDESSDKHNIEGEVTAIIKDLQQKGMIAPVSKKH